MIWLVVKQGVYMQGVYGPFDSEEEADGEARRLASLDTDGYHSWEVRELLPGGIEGTSWNKAGKAVAYAQQGEVRRGFSYAHNYGHSESVVMVPKKGVEE